MANSIVLELQQLSMERDNDISDLLRKSFLVASKLNLIEFKGWITNEQNGYKNSDVPDYRKLAVELKAKNPHRGLIPVMFDESELMLEIEDSLKNIKVCDPIESLCHVLENGDKNGYLVYPIAPDQQRLLNQIGDVSFEVIRIVRRNQVAIIIDAVRNHILEWSLKLEEENILGEGIFFSSQEKKKAKEKMSDQINIKNFQGVLGNVESSSVTQNLTMEISEDDIESLSRYLSNNNIDNNDIESLKDAIKLDPIPETKEHFGNHVNNWILKMIAKSADGSWNVGIATAGNILGVAIAKYYGIS